MTAPAFTARYAPPRFRGPRCGARTRAGRPCRAPAVAGKRRCRLHGGAPGSGAQPGNSNALKHGFYSKAAVEERRRLRALVRMLKANVEAEGDRIGERHRWLNIQCRSEDAQ